MIGFATNTVPILLFLLGPILYFVQLFCMATLKVQLFGPTKCQLTLLPTSLPQQQQQQTLACSLSNKNFYITTA